MARRVSMSTRAELLAAIRERYRAAPHPEKRFGPVLQTLVHLTAHFALHRGQMSYIVRMLK